MSKSRPYKKDRSEGFSLIEVIIAVAIFGLAATVLLSTFINALNARERSQNLDVIEADIRAVRMQLLLEPEREAAEEGGYFKTLNHGEASWEAVIEATNVVDLFKVELSVDFNDSFLESAITHTETLYLLRPTWSESEDRSALLEEKKQKLQDDRSFNGFYQ